MNITVKIPSIFSQINPLQGVSPFDDTKQNKPLKAPYGTSRGLSLKAIESLTIYTQKAPRKSILEAIGFNMVKGLLLVIDSQS